MSIQRDRLLSLLEFAHQSARLRGKPALAVSEHGLFAVHEHEIQGLPGIRVNINASQGDDEIWIAVKRLHELTPPNITAGVLRPWVQMTQSPNEEPTLREAIEGASLIAAGTHDSSASPSAQDKPTVDPKATVILSNHQNAEQIRAQLILYLDTEWRPWAEEEKLRRKTIRVYAQLFTLKQQLDGSLTQAPLELVWGVGMGIWKFEGSTVSYPILGRLVEMSLNAETNELEVRPRSVDARLEMDWYASVDNAGVAGVEKAAKAFFAKATATFSPFDRGTFESLLRTAVANLDGNGVYWPNEVPADDRRLPKSDDKLKVTDTWVLFARPRTNSLFLQDLERLKNQAEETESYPPAVASLVTDPETANPVIELPCFRGVSASYHAERGTTDKKPRDLYFPKPFNSEQVRIIELLDVFDGVVVQGPPGTGKTHTIANVICHYLAEGKRVLVTSMKDPALVVLRDQLPAEIRPLAISLLSSEQDGMKQFEHAIHKIASEVQSLDRSSTATAIRHLEQRIDALHGRLSGIDRQIGDWARKNLDKIILETEELDPQDAAREVVEGAGQFEWIPDPLGIAREFTPQFSDLDVVRLREARRALKTDIDYLNASLPQLVELPDWKMLLEVHQDLSKFEKLRRDVESGEVPALADSSQETLGIARQLLTCIETLRRSRDEILQKHQPWTGPMLERLRCAGDKEMLQMLEILGKDLEQAVERHRAFLERPVTTSVGVELDPDLMRAVSSLAEGKRPFGLKGLMRKSESRKQLDRIRILGASVTSSEDWRHVAEYLMLLRRLRALALRWNALVQELRLEAALGDKPEDGLAAARGYALYLMLKDALGTEGELCTLTPRVFPSWPNPNEIAENGQQLSALESALRHHLTKGRLANAWTNKDRCQTVLESRSGRIIEEMRDFLAGGLGNPEITDSEMRTKWSSLTTELSRVLALATHLATVREVSDNVETSGAPRYAAALRQQVPGIVDGLLPDSWRKAWRLKRLATYLDSTDAEEELKELARGRREVENDLSHAYTEITVKRTWLKLAENASPSIRAALQAFLTAIQKIRKGTGKRAVRFRNDARMAASLANPAVPCWIMAHYRVSESLPAELGCFDLVVIDEASQSDLTALPSLLRARKILVVGDDKQVSPEGVGLEEEKICNLMSRFLENQVKIYRQQMSPERSIYDLFRVVFARSAVMLKEHFRCVEPIIEYSKREFYNHELRPLRIPKASERLDPPLIDVVVQDGYRRGDVNLPEARFIADEIKAIAADPRMRGRSMGVVSLLGDKQALKIWGLLNDELGPEAIQNHSIACGDARTFQGKERDIMFLSMVSAPNEVGAPLSGAMYEQRFNVAASRARDRMYLVRSVGPEHLSKADCLRRALIEHFAAPFAQDEVRVEDLRKLCESPFEREMYDELTRRGYRVVPQVRVGQYRIDMVIEGHNDSRLAVECDGDRYHGGDKWADDMLRQRVLERAGWVFWRCFASSFVRRRKQVIDDLLRSLAGRGIEPIGSEGAPRSVHTEHRVVSSTFLAPDRSRPTATNVPENGRGSKPTVMPPSTDAFTIPNRKSYLDI